MRRKIAYIFIVFIAIACKLGVYTKKEYFSNGVLKEQIQYKDSIKHGEALTYFANGKLKEKYYYTDGLLNGEYLAYDSLNKLTIKGGYLNGKQAGPFYFYFPNGKLRKYIEFDSFGNSYYIQSFDSLSNKIAYEHGHCITKWTSEDYTIDSGTKYELKFHYSEPDGYENTLTAFLDNKEAPVKKSKQHLAVVKTDNDVSNKKLIVYSRLLSNERIEKCRDSIIITLERPTK